MSVNTGVTGYPVDSETCHSEERSDEESVIINF